MSRTYVIAVRPIGQQTGADLVADADGICGERFETIGKTDTAYRIKAQSGGLMLDLDAEWDDEADPDDPIPYHLFPWEFVKDDGQGREAKRLVFNLLRDLYVGLVTTGRYHCMFYLPDSETVIASNVPGYEKGAVQELYEPDAFARWTNR
ncbi:MAG TPA: hypothetical protein VF444_18795 [Pseudonocardiaceae bacterium]